VTRGSSIFVRTALTKPRSFSPLFLGENQEHNMSISRDGKPRTTSQGQRHGEIETRRERIDTTYERAEYDIFLRSKL
jgi:hypothetical protein